jgi:hypothetical protein
MGPNGAEGPQPEAHTTRARVKPARPALPLVLKLGTGDLPSIRKHKKGPIAKSQRVWRDNSCSVV